MQLVFSPKTAVCLSKTKMRLNDCLLLHVHKDLTNVIEDINK